METDLDTQMDETSQNTTELSSPNSEKEDKPHASLNKFEWGTRGKSAFLPYRPASTVLTNLQRGNTEAAGLAEEVKFNFHARAAQGEVTREQIIAEGCDTLDSTGLTALHWAAFYGQFNTVHMLLECGASVDVQGPENETALLLAAAGGNHETVKLLIERGADVNHADIIGNTALMYAAAGNHPHTSNNIIIRGANVNLTNDHDESAYSLAVKAHAHLGNCLCSLLLVAAFSNRVFKTILSSFDWVVFYGGFESYKDVIQVKPCKSRCETPQINI